MRLLVTGARGQLGGELVAALGDSDHQVTALGRAELDLAEPGAAERALRAEQPDAVINCAAYTRVDAAETDPDAARRDNTTGPRLLAAACDAAAVHLVHISTDFVFDGTGSSPIDEETPPAPLGVYGATKLAGEEEVRRLCRRHAVVRTSWLYGRDGPNFVLTMLRLAKERGSLRVVADQQGSPTWTGHLTPALIEIAERGITGTLHLSNSGSTSWHGLACAALAAAGMDTVPVTAITTADYPTPARRPAYSVLDNRVWRGLGAAPLPPWQEGVRAYLASRQG